MYRPAMIVFLLRGHQPEDSEAGLWATISHTPPVFGVEGTPSQRNSLPIKDEKDPLAKSFSPLKPS